MSEYYITSTADNIPRQFVNFIKAYKIINPLAPFVELENCDMCEGNGKPCSYCNDGVITYFFNSEPNEPNVIGINERMVND